MAILQTIRKRSGLLMIIIGLALLAFLLTDFINSGFTMFGGASDKNVAVINGQVIKWQEYNKIVDIRNHIYPNSSPEQQDFIKEQIWVESLQSALMNKEYNTLGLGVSEDELNDLSTGTNPHQLIKSNFSNPQTRQFNRSDLLAFVKNMENDPRQKASWLYLQDQLKKIRFFEKYNSLISKALYTTNLEAQINAEESAKNVNINYIIEPFTSISDSSVSYNDDDLKKYYNEHLNEYKQDESRDIEYVIFNVDASKEDKQAISDHINEIYKPFSEADSNATRRMIRLESNISFDEKYYKESELSSIINDFMFKAKKGDSYGPYIEDNSYKISKLMEIKYASDSARARHILLQLEQQTKEDYLKTMKLADSIKTLLNNGANFSTLAAQYSKDKGSAVKGGELGWFKDGQMVKPFQDACFFGKKGDIVIVPSNFGIHIIEIEEKGIDTKRVLIASIVKNILPSRTTRNMVYRKATDFSMKNTTIEQFREAANNTPDLELKTSNNLTKTSNYIPDIETPKDILAWVFNAKKDEVNQDVINIKDNKFVIVALSDIKEKGTAPFEQEKSQIEFEVIKEKKAKAIKEKINKELLASNNINELAQKLNISVQEASNINFYQSRIQGSDEPIVVTAALSYPTKKISSTIIGNSGVYVFEVTAVNKTTAPDVAQLKKQLQQRFSMKNTSRPNYPYQDVYTSAFFEVIKKNADIDDNRLSLYSNNR